MDADKMPKCFSNKISDPLQIKMIGSSHQGHLLQQSSEGWI